MLKQGAAAISNTKVADAAQAAGKLVGAAAAEIILGKGVGVAFKGLSALSNTKSGAMLLAQIAGAARKAKETIGALEIPVGAKAVEIALEGGRTIKLPVAETKRLDEIILQMKASNEKLGVVKGGIDSANHDKRIDECRTALCRADSFGKPADGFLHDSQSRTGKTR